MLAVFQVHFHDDHAFVYVVNTCIRVTRYTLHVLALGVEPQHFDLVYLHFNRRFGSDDTNATTALSKKRRI